MNCFNHPEEAAVAKCVDCGKNLCKVCATTYKKPICSECNLIRVQKDKIGLIWVVVSSVILLIAGIIFNYKFNHVLGIFFPGIPWGWKFLSRFWVRNREGKFYYIWTPVGVFAKICASIMVGIVALPVEIIIRVVDFVRAKKIEKTVIGELSKQSE